MDSVNAVSMLLFVLLISYDCKLFSCFSGQYLEWSLGCIHKTVNFTHVSVDPSGQSGEELGLQDSSDINVVSLLLIVLLIS